MTDAPLIEAEIVALGAQGHGVAETEIGRLYVPFALPGDRVNVRRSARKGDADSAVLVNVLQPSEDRIEPACGHFGTCGGCSLQHMAPAAYGTFKRRLVVDALAQRGLSDVDVMEPVLTPQGSRRRARLSARRAGKRVILGYAERSSHRLVDVQECPVLAPPLMSLLAPLREVLKALLQPNGEMQIALSALETGVDMLLIADMEPDLEAREKLVQLAIEHDIARVSWETGGISEPIIIQREPVVKFGTLAVVPPPGAFLQASAQAEAVMMAFAQHALEGKKKVADLFAGCGTFSGALAGQGYVHALETDEALVTSLQNAGRRSHGRVTAEKRDLFREPLTALELNQYEAVIIDPPRAGARAQTDCLADSNVPIIVAFSCNPATFARDARTLVDGGYSLQSLTPIDQFLWSAHVELAAVFSR